MFELLQRLFKRENVLALISITAFMMSGLTWVFAFVNNKKKIKISVIAHEKRNFNDKFADIFVLSIENMSKTSIAISQLSLLHKNKLYRLEQQKHMVFNIKNKRNNIVVRERELFSVSFPINLDSLQAISGYFVLMDCQETLVIPAKPLTFQVCSNRGKAFQIELLLDEDICPVVYG